MRDILIIGSGPAGLSASVYAKRANLDVLVAEKEFMGTGQIAESARVDNYLGLAGKSGYDLGELFRGDAESMGVEFREGEAVRLTRRDNIWLTEFDNGEAVESKAVIYAAGTSHRRLNVSGEEKFIGNGISFCALCDGSLYQGKTVAVIGGGDTALDDALYLSDIAAKVYLIHRRNEFRGSPKTVEKVTEKANIEIVLKTTVAEIIGSDRIESVRLGSGKALAVDGIFVAIGMEPKTELLKGIAELDDHGYAIADESGTTNAVGLFVAGDVRTKRLRQVVTAVSDGANAAVSAIDYLKNI